VKVLVTGAGGYLGRPVVEALVTQGHEVRATVRRTAHRLPSAVEVRVLDLEATDEWDSLVEGVDAVVHLAGLVSRHPRDASRMYRLHVEVTRRMLDASRGKRIVLASTSGTVAVSDVDRGPMDEMHEPSLEVLGRWPYYMSKHHQEREVLRWTRAGEGEAVILNPSLLLGPGDEKVSSTADVLDILNQRYPAAVDGTVALVDVRDVAPVFERALREGTSGQRYLLNGANMSVRRFAERVATLGGVAAPRFVLPGRWALAGAKLRAGLDYARGREDSLEPVHIDLARHHWACDDRRARTTFGFAPRDPALTLKDTVQDLRSRRLFVAHA
jgi:dihydroflavonol-4-reductase